MLSTGKAGPESASHQCKSQRLPAAPWETEEALRRGQLWSAAPGGGSAPFALTGSERAVSAPPQGKPSVRRSQNQDVF